MGILVAHRFTNDAYEWAKKSRFDIILAHKATFVDVVRRYQPQHIQQWDLAVVKVTELKVQFETQQQKIEAIELQLEDVKLQQIKNTFWSRMTCFFVFCCIICLLYIVFLVRNKN